MTDFVPAALIYRAVDASEDVFRLYCIEQEIDTDLWALWCRTDERGEGTPLTWTTFEAADKVIKEMAEESGCYGGSRVVCFGIEARHAAPVRCDLCGEWGHLERDCAGPDSELGSLVVP